MEAGPPEESRAHDPDEESYENSEADWNLSYSESGLGDQARRPKSLFGRLLQSVRAMRGRKDGDYAYSYHAAPMDETPNGVTSTRTTRGRTSKRSRILLSLKRAVFKLPVIILVLL